MRAWTWDKEKEYRSKRAKVLGEEMDRAIDVFDKEQFLKAFTTAKNYMKQNELCSYYKRFLEKTMGGNER